MSWYNCCCKAEYTTRCYDHDGTTIWTANYWDGASNGGLGAPSTNGIAVDSAGNTYVCGPCALSSTSSATWSLVSYDPDGEVRWKKDVRTPIRAFGGIYATWNGLANDVVCTDDDRIVLLCQEVGSVGSGTVPIMFAYKPDGTSATMPTIIDSVGATFGSLRTKMFTVNNAIRFRGLRSVFAGQQVLPSAAACKVGGSTTKFLSDGGGGNDYMYYQAFGGLDFTNNPAITEPYGCFWSAYLRPGTSGSTPFSSMTTLCTSFDGSKFYGSGNNLRPSLDGATIETGFQTMRFVLPGRVPVFSGGLWSWDSSGVASGNIIWGVGGPLRTCSTAISNGIVVGGGGGTPRIQALRDSDGCTLWAHNHQSLANVVSNAYRIYSTGDKRKTSNDEDFVSVDGACEPCDGDCVYTALTDSATETTYDSNATVTFTGYGRLKIEVWGGGGGGGGDMAGNTARQGGGAGEKRTLITYYTPATTLTLTIGAAGAQGGVSFDSGVNGGYTTVTGTYPITANGGKGGQGATGSNTGAGGDGGSGGTGSPGGNGSSPAGANGGSGGNAVDGGTGGAGGGGGLAGNTPGGGGAGCDNQFGAENGLGGNGANGRVKITVQPAEWEFSGDDCTGSGCSPCRDVDSTFYDDYGYPSSSGDEITIPCE